MPYYIYRENLTNLETGVDPSLHSNDLDYEVERKFGWG